jgi:hypothetical protein
VAELTIAGEGGNTVSITVRERERPNPLSEGWLDAEVAVKVGPWSGRFFAQFHEDDFFRFADELNELDATLQGGATLSSLDGYLDLTLTGDGLGHISVVGEAWDRPRWASHLVISYETDQTALSPLRVALMSLVENLTGTG